MKSPHCLLLAVSSLSLAVLSRPPQTTADRPTEGLVTLYAHDDLRSSLDLRTGGPGGRVAGGEIDLSHAQLAYDVFAEDRLTFGFLRDERVNVVDLGPLFVPPRDRATDRAPEFAISVFHTLFLDGTRFSYLEAGGDVRRLADSHGLQGALPREGTYHVEPRIGHTYLLRAQRDGVGARDEYFKFQVIEHDPGNRVTLRWARV